MNSKEEIEPSEVKKRNLARKKVQDEMDELRKQIRELREKEASGGGFTQDIEACMGYLKVLKKELHSIKESSHTTFLSAKKLISPKFNYGTKKEELLATIKSLAMEIREANKKLTGGSYSADDRQSIQERLMDHKTKHQEALLELKAIEQFNHTRFLEQKAVQENRSLDKTPPRKPKKLKSHLFKKEADQDESPKQEPNREQYNDFDPPAMI